MTIAQPSTDRIAELFARSRAENRAALIMYLTAGYPDLETTRRLLPVLEANGCDLVEFGIPFSDPIADGPIIQQASTLALTAGMSLRKGFEVIAEFRKTSAMPLVLFGALNPFLAFGLEKCVEEAARLGIDGFLIPDLPLEEAAEFRGLCRPRGLHLVQFIAPTTPPDRMKAIATTSSGFLYCFALKGITGLRDSIDVNLGPYMADVRRATDLPLAIGFGISRPEHVASVVEYGDAAVVGTGLIRVIMECTARGGDLESEVGAYVRGLAAALPRKRA
jgi:tryptophan synthase alpha chain